LALRVGNEKEEDLADTVGCCSLRVEHIKILDDDEIELDFLGKDSMRYFNKVKVDSQVHKNLKSFVKKKKPKDDLFDMINPTIVNKHLKSLMPGLSAKVFRTYNASITLQDELAKSEDIGNTVEEKMLFYNRANKEVAILCNHQRSLPKTHSTQMEKLDGEVDDVEKEISVLKDALKGIRPAKKAKTTKKEKKRKKKKKKKKKKHQKKMKKKHQKKTKRKLQKKAKKKLQKRMTKRNHPKRNQKIVIMNRMKSKFQIPTKK